MKDLIEKILNSLPEGSELLPLVTSLKREATSVLESLTSANSESKTRKLKIRELEAEKEDLEHKFETVTTENVNLKEKTTEADSYKTKLEEYQTKESEKLVSEWGKVKEKLSVDETDPNFSKLSKIKDRFAFGEDEKPLTIEQLQSNLENYKHYDDLGLFSTPNNNQQPFTANPKGTPEGNRPLTWSEILNSTENN